jgi:UDP-N-acetylmuramate dehydrogenase
MEKWLATGHHSMNPLDHSNARSMLVMAKTTNHEALVADLAAIAGMKLRLDELLARYTSMKIGGPADYFIEVDSFAALAEVLVVLRRHEVPLWLLGNGSNVLISDRGVRGAVIHLAGEFKKIEWREVGDSVEVTVGAAYAVTQLVRQAARKGYAGLEFAEGIPGTVGGALVMNAGAYGSEFEKVVERVEAIDRDGQSVLFSRPQMTFSYRDSHLPAGTVVTRVLLRLRLDEAAQVDSKLRELVGKRKSSQPSGFPNSGSMFRNPPGDYAGRLIEAAGLKGHRIGQAQISERHANFIVNHGGAKAAAVRQLMEVAQGEVRRLFDIDLVPEVKFVGEWPDE